MAPKRRVCTPLGRRIVAPARSVATACTEGIPAVADWSELALQLGRDNAPRSAARATAARRCLEDAQSRAERS
jgi:hypothetical protein